jgi:hypothetical protein
MKVQMESALPAIQLEKQDSQIARPAMLKKKTVVMMISRGIAL